MRHLFLSILCITLLNITCQAQKILNVGQQGMGIVKGSEVLTQGSIYYGTVWVPGAVISSEKATFDNLDLRYNLKDQTILVKMEGDQVKIIGHKTVENFTFTDKSGMVHEFANGSKYNLKGKTVNGFVEILSQGTGLDLIYKHSVKLKPAQQVDSYGSGGASATPEYIKQMDLFYVKDDKTLDAVNSKKDLLALFGDKAAKMKAYMKKNKVKLREFGSMKAMMEHYKTL